MLRWLTILGIVLLIPYFWVWQLWAAVAWNVAFLLINIGRLVVGARASAKGAA